ncbi:hypothetical protein ACFYNO_27270 [Kitasatospora sp. NPDC006697]|uniref:SCO2583/SCO2584 N-terminal domain-containing protein n=1 Tax=Kitasatospora sp. NPDC006697 TaxID=3364020 RepID=UPI00369F0464
MPITEDPEPRPSGEEPDPFENLVLDEDFVQSATVKEASGRSRMLSARWKRKPPETETAWRPPTEIRRSRFGRRAKQVDPWGNKRRSRPSWHAPVYVLLAVGVVLAAVNVNGLHDWYQRNFNGDGGADSGVAAAPPSPVVTQAPETAQPTAAPPTQDVPQTPTVAHPWIGSPAESWPTGSAAITLPQAGAVGAFDADQVGQDLALVKKYLVASNLEPDVLNGQTAQPVLDLLESRERQRLSKAIANPTKDEDATDWFSRFDPKTSEQAVPDVHLQGWVTFKPDGKNGLLVQTDYTFVYALAAGPQKFEPTQQQLDTGGSPSPTANAQSVSFVQSDPLALVQREVVRRIQDFEFYDPDRYQVEPNRIELSHFESSTAGNWCVGGVGWLEPEFPDDNRNGPEPSQSGPTEDPYNQSQPLRTGGGCGTASRL